jgi:hypothetical protein
VRGSIVDALTFAEARRRRRVARLLRRMDRLDRGRRRWSGARLGRRALASCLLLVLLLGGLWRLSLREDDVPGLPERPVDAQSRRIDPVAAPVVTSDAFELVSRQKGSDDPVTYDPCVPIHVVVDPRTIVDDGMRMLREALDRVMDATGLVLVVDGLAEPGERPEGSTRTSDGERWSPVLVSWSDPGETPELVGRVAGLGGSTSLEIGKHRWYVTGKVTLDGPQIDKIVDQSGWASGRAVVMHELGHLVGLDHVGDEGQLMQPEGRAGLDAWGDGDLTGLAALGRGRCIDY